MTKTNFSERRFAPKTAAEHDAFFALGWSQGDEAPREDATADEILARATDLLVGFGENHAAAQADDPTAEPLTRWLLRNLLAAAYQRGRADAR